MREPHSNPKVALALEAAWRHLMAAQGDDFWSDGRWEREVAGHIAGTTESGFRVPYTEDSSWYDGLKRAAHTELQRARVEWHRAAHLMGHEERTARGVEWVAEDTFLMPEARVAGLEDAFEREVGYLTSVHVQLGGLIHRDDDDIPYPFQVQERQKKKRIVVVYVWMFVGLVLTLSIGTCG